MPIFFKALSVQSLNSLSNTFIKEFQFIVVRNDLDYNQLNKDVVRNLLLNYRKFLKKFDENVLESKDYGNFLLAFMNILFYSYSLGMNASSTFKVSQCIVLICKSLNAVRHSTRENIFSKLISEIDFVMSVFLTKSNPEETNINILNLIISLTQFGDRYLLSEKKLGQLLRIKNLDEKNFELNYFEILTLLYYIEDRKDYDKIRTIIKNRIIKIFQRTDSFSKSENFMLFFDLMCCPYLNEKFKIKICKDSKFSSKNSSNANVVKDINNIGKHDFWFFKWDKDINLESVLKTKEWINVY